MRHIQVDMFEVQLGASLLLQFRDGERIVRILADAGVRASDYPPDHVHKKLSPAFAAFGDGDRRIDLVIGTHYDADHLEGLVPIIEDQTISITEAWMPPVANDTEVHAVEDDPHADRFLAMQFASEAGPQKLREYLDHKGTVCKSVMELEHAADEFRPTVRRSRNLRAALERPDIAVESRASEDAELAFFKAQHSDAAATLGEADLSHADDAILLPLETRPDAPGHRSTAALPGWGDADGPFRPYITSHVQDMTARWSADPGRADIEARSLASIRKSAARDAINAISLAKVARALASRRIPIVCQTINDGQPRRFVWDTRQGRFIPGRQLQTTGPELALLGPSIGLVKKHWDRLPIGTYVAMAHLSRLPIKSITPSNQLSYVVRVGFAEQGLLIAGDAGCVDFRPSSNQAFYPALLGALLPLHIVQVAHHGGNNADFYNVLIDAAYGQQTAPSWLLLSHATDDRTRPSPIFASFIGEVRRTGDDMRLLFTSRPSAAKVRDFLPLIWPPIGAPADVGDVRLSFDGRDWRVEMHSIQVH